MNDTFYDLSGQLRENPVVNLAASNWYLILLLIILGSIAACLVLFMLTKNPKDWEHTSLVNNMQTTGKLKDLAESMKTMSHRQSGFQPVQGLIKRLFFEKMKTMENLSDEEMQKLYRNDPLTLQKYIHDKEIADWLLGTTSQRSSIFPFFRKEKTQDQIINLNRIVEKMEAWGK